MRLAAPLIFLLALALRLAVIVQLLDEPLFRTPQLDALEYVEWGERMAGGDLSWPAEPIHGPGYPLLIAAVLAISGSLIALPVVQAIFGSIAAMLTFLIARRTFGDVAGVAAGLLHAIYAPLILVDVSLLAEGFFIFLLTLTLWLMSNVRHSTPAIVALGLVLGVAIIVRPTAAALVPLYAWFLPRRFVALASFVAATAIPVIPVFIQNRALAIQASGGMNFYIGNAAAHDGTAWARPGAAWDEMRGMAWRAGVRGADAEDRFYVRRALDEINLRVIASKFVWLIQDEEVRDSHSFHFFAASSPLLRWLPRFGIVFALAMCGIVARRAPLIAGYAIVMALVVILLVAGFRYRMPLMPGLLIFAGAGVSALIRRRVLVFVFLAAIVISNLRVHGQSHEFSEELAMTALALKNEGDLTGAADAARRAVAINPHRDAAWVALGDIEATRGRWDEAERMWRRAIEIAPENTRAWAHLAHAHIRRGEMAEAEAALRRALSIRADAEALANLNALTRR